MEQPLQATVEKLLQELHAKEPYIRKAAAEELGKLSAANEQMLSVLNNVIRTDDNKYVKRAAADTYFILTGERSPEEIIEQESIDAEVSHQQHTATLADKVRQNKRLIITLAVIVVGFWLLVIITRPEINTSAGTLVITKARFTDRVPPDCTSSSSTCSTAQRGYRILLVWMKPKGGSNEPAVPPGVYVVADNGSQAEWFHQQTNVSPPWVLLAFVVKDSDRNFKLVMPNNSSANLNFLLYLIP